MFPKTTQVTNFEPLESEAVMLEENVDAAERNQYFQNEL